jgi:hypothetical protein
LEPHLTDTPSDRGVAAIIATLEQQLTILDRLGLRIAAAHLDMSIQQLRLGQASNATENSPTG